MTGGWEARSRAAKSASEQFSGAISIVTDDIVDFGKAPPPTFTALPPIAILTGKASNRPAIAAARARNSFSEPCKRAIAGISDVDWLRGRSTVDYRTARTHLSQRNARNKG